MDKYHILLILDFKHLGSIKIQNPFLVYKSLSFEHEINIGRDILTDVSSKSAHLKHIKDINLEISMVIRILQISE